jgi:hypothetical protein
MSMFSSIAPRELGSGVGVHSARYTDYGGACAKPACQSYVRTRNFENRIFSEYHFAPSAFAFWSTIGSSSERRFTDSPSDLTAQSSRWDCAIGVTISPQRIGGLCSDRPLRDLVGAKRVTEGHVLHVVRRRSFALGEKWLGDGGLRAIKFDPFQGRGNMVGTSYRGGGRRGDLAPAY